MAGRRWARRSPTASRPWPVRTVGEKISFASGYGPTETGPTACNVHWTNEVMGLIGLPIPGTSVRLVPTAGKFDFRVKGPQISKGYLGLPERSAQAFDDEGFYILERRWRGSWTLTIR